MVGIVGTINEGWHRTAIILMAQRKAQGLEGYTSRGHLHLPLHSVDE